MSLGPEGLGPMWAAWAMIVGGVTRIAGELVEIVTGQYSGLSAGLTAAGLVLIGLGFAGLWGDAHKSGLGRIAIWLLCLGVAMFIAIAVWVGLDGTMPSQTVSRLPIFLAAALVTLAGGLALALWLIKSGLYPVWIGITLSVCLVLSVVVGLAGLTAFVQPIIDVVLALAFIQLGLSMRERFSKARKAK